MKKDRAWYGKGQFLSILGVFLLSCGTALAATSSNDSNPLTTPTDISQTSSLPDRLAQRKSALKLQISSERSQKLVKNCVSAQTRLKNIGTKDKSSADKRQETYTDLATRLNTIVRRLEIQGTDVSELKSAQSKFNSSINQYLSDMQTYKTTMDDIVVMDCKTDPSGFEATLTTARQLRAKLANDVSQIKSLKSELTDALSKAKSLFSAADKSEKNQ